MKDYNEEYFSSYFVKIKKMNFTSVLIEIWELNIESDSTRYKLVCDEEKEGMLNLENTIFHTPHDLHNRWQSFSINPQELKYQSDFSELEDINCLIVNQEVVDVYDHLVQKKEVEFLPFVTEKYSDNLYLMNVLNILKNSLDETESDINRLSSSNIISNIDYLYFRSTSIKNLSIFKIEELPYSIFISNLFKKDYDSAKLKGLEFSEENFIWTNN